jgi:hypothetical protein
VGGRYEWEGEGMWLIDFIYCMKQNEETSCNCFMWGREGVEGRDNGGDVTNVQCKSNQNCHDESPPCITNVS